MAAAGNTKRKYGSARSRGGSSKSIPPEKLLVALKEAQVALSKDSSLGLLDALHATKLKTPLVLAGDQHIRAKRTIDWIREQFFKDEMSSTSSYFGTELTSKKSIEAIVASVGTPSLFSKQSLLVIYNADTIKAALAKELNEVLTRAQSSTLVVLTATDMSKKTALPTLVAATGTLVEIKELEGPKLRKWMNQEAKRSGAAGLAEDAAAALIKYCGPDTTLLAREITKLSLLSAPDQPVSRALVEQISFNSPEVTSFELIQRLAKKDAKGSVTLAHSLVERGMHPMQLSYFLSRCFRTILAQKSSNKDGLASELTNYWFVKQLGSSLRAFSNKDLCRCIEYLKKLDFQLKDSAIEDNLALSIVLQRIALR